MRLLAIDSSAKAASVAILEDGVLKGEFFIHTKLTHSQTLMPMVQDLLSNTNYQLQDMDAFAIAAGPGSFTGIRIGVAAVKGMAMAEDKCCIPVSTLEAMAYQTDYVEGVVCAVMDARCNQVYNALFTVEQGVITRLTEDRALSIDQLEQDLLKIEKPIFFVGDGADLCYNKDKICQSFDCNGSRGVEDAAASGVAKAAACKSREEWETAAQLMPVYLRPPQAERELRKRQALTLSDSSQN